MHSRLDLPQTHLVLRQSYRLGAWEEEKGVGGFQGSVARCLDFLTTSGILIIDWEKEPELPFPP